MVVQEKLVTAEEFWEYSKQNKDVRLRLIDGELVEMTPAGGEHGEIGLRIGFYIYKYVHENQLGRCTIAETGYVVKRSDSGDTVLAPDVGFVKIERAPEPFSTGFVPMPPDLAVEVISPSETRQSVNTKLDKYLQSGVLAVWLVYPQSQTIVIHTIITTDANS